MRLWYWCSLAIMMLVFAINIVAAPILYHGERHLPVHKTLYVGRELSEDELAVVIIAAWEWHSATDGQVVMDVVRLPVADMDMDNCVLIINIPADFPNMIGLDRADPKGTHLAYYYEKAAIPYIGLVPSRISDRNYKTVLLHELGHSLGLKHNEGWEGIGTLMYGDISVGADYITDYDLKRFCELYGCDASKLHNQ